MAGLGPAWPSRTLLVLPPPPLISTPVEESGTSQHRCPTVQLSRHCWVLAERLYACKAVHGLERSQGRELHLCFRSPCARRQASRSPGRDTTNDSACHVTGRGRVPGPGWAKWRCPQLHSPAVPTDGDPCWGQSGEYTKGGAYSGLTDEGGTWRWGEEPERRRGQRKGGPEVGTVHFTSMEG